MHRRTGRGFTMVEMMVTIVLLTIVGAAVVRLMIGQAVFFDKQRAGREARVVSRAALNVLLSELRMVEAPGGLAAATASSLTLRVPYAVGIMCGTVGPVTTVSLLPADSAMFAEAGLSGYAWRNDAGVYSYVESGVSLGAGSAAQCTGAGITTLTGGRASGVSPALPVTASAGSAVLIYRRITYEFANSVAIPGRIALWRRVEATGAAEELVAPFDNTARFRFFTLNANAAQDAVPPLADVRGVELLLVGASENIVRGDAAYQQATTNTAVFFRNRLQ